MDVSLNETLLMLLESEADAQLSLVDFILHETAALGASLNQTLRLGEYDHPTCDSFASADFIVVS